MTTEAVLRDIYERRGRLTPAIVVDESKPTDAPLHDRIWGLSDGEAADAHRLHLAAQIIRSVKVRRVDPDELPPRDLRGFIHIPPEEDADETVGEYVPVDVVATNPRLSALAESQMKREIQALSRRYSAYTQYRDLLAAEVERLAS